MSADCGDSFSRRSSTGYHPSVWGDYFLQHSHHEPAGSKTKGRMEKLKEQVRSLFEDAADGLLRTMDLVDSIHLLGLAYHFDREINEALERIYRADTVDNFGLYETALWFRLLRRHGYHASPSVFNKFRDESQGESGFSSTLKDDTKGLLSLYNAAFLGTHGERILDEAIVFARSHLKISLAAGLLREPNIAARVSLALERPLHRRTRGPLHCRKYIAIYEMDAARDDAVLELAKLDFNRLQALHVRELKQISKWWADLALAKSLTFIRDRVVECYYWIVAALPEPNYSRARVMSTKIMALMTTTDDIYDNYSTLEECQLLTDSIQRWEPKAVDLLPECLKEFYIKLINSVEELKNELSAEEKYRISYLVEEIKLLARNYNEEVKWRVEKDLPTVEVHLELSMHTIGFRTVYCVSYVGMGEIVTKEALEWSTAFPELMRTSSIICRITNDTHSHELEQERDHVASTVECYMKQHKTDAKEAQEKLQLMVEDVWKDLNEECIRSTLPIPRALIQVAVDLARSMEDVYCANIDSFTIAGTTMKDNIFLAFAQPIY